MSEETMSNKETSPHKDRMASLEATYNAIRLTTPEQFEEHFEHVREQFQAHEPSEDHSDIPMLALPIRADTDSQSIIEIGDTISYWSTPNGSHSTLDDDLRKEMEEENEIVLYLDCRTRAPTFRHFRALILLNIANMKNILSYKHEDIHETSGRYSENICDICETLPRYETGFIGVTPYLHKSDESSSFSLFFCAECEDEIVELISSLDPVTELNESMSFEKIFMSQSKCGFCDEFLEDKSPRSGAKFQKPPQRNDCDSGDLKEELYAICPGCHSVLREFFDNIGVSFE